MNLDVFTNELSELLEEGAKIKRCLDFTVDCETRMRQA